jgi:hypothetical protein
VANLPHPAYLSGCKYTDLDSPRVVYNQNSWDADSLAILSGGNRHASTVLLVTRKDLGLGNPQWLNASRDILMRDKGNGGFSFADDVTSGLHGGFLPCFDDSLSHVPNRFARPLLDNILCVSADFA